MRTEDDTDCRSTDWGDEDEDEERTSDLRMTTAQDTSHGFVFLDFRFTPLTQVQTDVIRLFDTDLCPVWI